MGKVTYPPAAMTPSEAPVDRAGFSHVLMFSLSTHLGLINTDRAILAPRRRTLLDGDVIAVVVVAREPIAARATGDDMSRG